VTWGPDYATTAQVKAFLRITDSVDDTEIASAITDASRAIDAATSRQFGNVAAEKRTYRAYWDAPLCRWTVTIDDLQDITGMIVTVGGVAVTKYTLRDPNAVKKGKAFTCLTFNTDAEVLPTRTAPDVDITAPWGWTAVPVAVVNACKIQAGRFHKRRDALFGVAGSPQDGSEVRLLAKLDPDVQVSLSFYVRRWGAV